MGITIVMSLNPAYKMKDFFSMQTQDEIFTCPYLGHQMARNRYQIISQRLQVTDLSPPTHRNMFWEVRQIQDEWNTHMEHAYHLSWLVVMDESMVLNLNPRCPGWLNVKQKPHSFDNEYHSSAD
mmetsp:Transcript_1202/g.2431  ORF Transcript_1202/g.2431 Transcript_1202/m.2431 type:complete len:124 (-) Transcript_1202:949-1320(-)